MTTTETGWTTVPITVKKKQQTIATNQITATKVWAEYEAERLDIQLANKLEQRRAADQQGNINRKVVWFRMHIATDAEINEDITPTLYEHEKIVDSIIAALDLDFPVDIAWIRPKDKPFTLNNKSYISTYVALTPNLTTPCKERAFLQNLGTLEENLIQLFLDPEILRDPDPGAMINHYHFTIPAVNDYDEHLQFFIEGIDTSIVFKSARNEETATQRELAAEIFRAFVVTYKETFPTKALPPSIANIRDLHSVSSIISTRNSYFPDSKNNIIGLAFSTHNEKSDTLLTALIELCTENNRTLNIGGSKIPITLHLLPLPKDSRKDTLNRIIETNKNMANSKQFKIIKDIPSPPSILDDPSLTTILANSLKNCIGICINLKYGRSNPTLCCIHLLKLTSTQISQDSITTTLHQVLSSRGLATTTQANISPPPPLTHTQITRGRGRGKPPLSSPSKLNKNLPIYTTVTIKNRKYYPIINGIGGIATANIYYGHWEDDGIINLVHGVSQSVHRSSDTYSGAMAQFTLWYSHCDTQEKIDFMNLNAIMEASNLNNPCPPLRQQYGPYVHDPDNTLNQTWTLNTVDPVILQLRTMASERMRSTNRSPTDCYDFLDDNFQGPRTATLPNNALYYIHNNIPTIPTPTPSPSRTNTTPTNQATTHGNNNTNKTPPQTNFQPTAYTPTTQQDQQALQPTQHQDNNFDTRSIQLSHISAVIPPHQPLDDEISEMSHQTGSLNINYVTNPKRARTTSSVVIPPIPQTATTTTQPPPSNTVNVSNYAQQLPSSINSNEPADHQTSSIPSSFVHFTVPMKTTPDEIRTLIRNTTSFPFPPNATDECIHFSIIPKSLQFKQSHIRIIDINASQAIAAFLNNIDSNANAYSSAMTPNTGTSEMDIDTSPPSNGLYPTNCRVIGCQLHRLGMEPPPSTTAHEDYSIIQHHGLTFHSDLLSSLPTNTLNSIHWYKCGEPCNHLAFSQYLLKDHQHQCQSYRQRITPRQPPLPQPTLPTIPTYDRTDTNHTRIQRLWNTCPRQHRQQLDQLLRSQTNIDDITNTVFDWIEQSTYITEATRRKND